ncbi:MAG: autotransporter outer membrane beta-barrel domain-containing protein [Planctomycetaceae bacterium]|nr:autotransporter outer membrane beta-barrel domain-containing protein [Planctomycetaceae bacterium]
MTTQYINNGITVTIPSNTATAGLFIDTNGYVYYGNNMAKSNVATYTLYSGYDIDLNIAPVSGIGLGGVISIYDNLKFDAQNKNFNIINTASVANGIAAGFAYYNSNPFNGSVTNYGNFTVRSNNSSAYGFIFSSGYPTVSDLSASSKFEIGDINIDSFLSGAGFQAGNQSAGSTIDVNKISALVRGGSSDSYGWGMLLKNVAGKINVDKISVKTASNLYQNMTESPNSAYGFAATSAGVTGEIELGEIDVIVGGSEAGNIRGMAVGIDIGASETTYTDTQRGQIAGKIIAGKINVTNYSKIDPSYGFHVGNNNVDNNTSQIAITGDVLLGDITVKNKADGVGVVAGVMVATSVRDNELKGLVGAGALVLDGKILADAGNGTATAYGIYAGQIELLNVTNSIIATGGDKTKSYGIYTTGSLTTPKGGLNSVINLKSNFAVAGKTASLSLNGAGDVVNILAPEWNNGGKAFILQDVEILEIGAVNNPVTATMVAGSKTDAKTVTTIHKNSSLIGAIQSEGKLNMYVGSLLGIQLAGGDGGRAGTYFGELGVVNLNSKFFVTDKLSNVSSPLMIFGSGVDGVKAMQIWKSINQLNFLHGIYEYDVLVDDNGAGKILKRQTEVARLSDVYLNILFMHSPFMREAVEKHVSDYRHQRQLLASGNSIWVNYVGRGGNIDSTYGRYEDAKLTANGIQTGIDLYFSRFVQYGVLFGYEDHSLRYNSSGEGRAALLNATNGTSLLDVDKAVANDFYFGIFGIYQIGFGGDVRFYAGAGFQSYWMYRYDLDDLRTSRFNGSTFESSIEYGYRLFSDGNLSLRPVLSIDYNYNTLNDAAEANGYVFSDAYLSQLFLRFGTDVNWKGSYWSLYGGVYYSQQVLGDGDKLTGNVQGSKLIGVEPGNSVINISFGARYKITKSLSVFGGYNAEIYADNKNAPNKNTGNIGLVWYWH